MYVCISIVLKDSKEGCAGMRITSAPYVVWEKARYGSYAPSPKEDAP
jgi:hypothetical protein